jgi:tetratricopeptide (TPR) repeat protein
MAMIDIKLEKWDKAIMHTTKALRVGANSKAYYRRALAYMTKNDIDAAKEDLTKAKELDPSSKEIREAEHRLDHMYKKFYAREKKAMGGFLNRESEEEEVKQEELAYMIEEDDDPVEQYTGPKVYEIFDEDS